jgi:hypothetical protein
MEKREKKKEKIISVKQERMAKLNITMDEYR